LGARRWRKLHALRPRHCYNSQTASAQPRWQFLSFMSFLDNLESTLKNMERASDKDWRRDSSHAQRERSNQARASAPFAEELKKGPFVNEFLTHAVRIGHQSRTKINMNWFGNVLRVEARERRLEFRPTPDGVQVVFHEDGVEQASELIDLKAGSPEKLAERWLS
jgi:hypothetical protein